MRPERRERKSGRGEKWILHSLTSLGFTVFARQAVEVWMSRAQRKSQHDRDITKFMHQECVATFFGTSGNADSLTPPWSIIYVSYLIIK